MKLQYLKTTSLMLEKEKCIGCGMCVDVCPHDVFTMEKKRAKIIDMDSCMECGACKSNCPVNAIDVTIGTGGVTPVLEEMLRRKPKS